MSETTRVAVLVGALDRRWSEGAPTRLRRSALAVLAQNLDPRDQTARARAAVAWDRVAAHGEGAP